ncbi:MAG: hypothetical protein U0411_10895 [Thermodesulfovibrionales bacterium]
MKENVMRARSRRPAGSLRAAAARFLVLFLLASAGEVLGADTQPGTPQAFHFVKNPEIQRVKPKKPVRIKLHRGAKGEYSWDLSGDSVDDVVRADARLRKLLKVE